ncbi:unnamed protein product [Owenia fusiformis]|uniref:DNA helicase n=1 Tax=Owenia fusiformis TaxID=6347 RepID=A0A8S4PVD1_OWEFU|nr:unnamed protein product [Owenia fusiformis]
MDEDDNSNQDRRDDVNSNDSSSSSSNSGSSSSGSGSSSGSDSDSKSGSSSSDHSSPGQQNGNSHGKHISVVSSSESHDDKQPKRQRIKDIKSMWEEMPDLYGVRRSGRSRAEPERFKVQSSDSDDHTKRRRGRKRKESDEWAGGSDDSDSSDSSDSSGSDGFRPARGTTRGARKQTNKRQTKKSAGRTGKKRVGRPRKKHSSSEEYSDSDDDRRQSYRSLGKKPVSKSKGSSRVSNRKTAKQNVSYKEDSNDETDSDDIMEATETKTKEVNNDAETIERVLDVRKGRKGCTGHKTTWYNVQDQGDPAEQMAGKDDEVTELQYLVKWKGWSHIHNTWESIETLKAQKVNGMKKLDNFIKTNNEIAMWKRQATPEDVEYFDCQQEMAQQLLDQHRNVERIIVHQGAHKTVAGQNDYLVKWSGLPYSDSTWEDGDLIEKKFPELVKSFTLRNKSQKIPTKVCKALKYRPKFIQMKHQPNYLGGDNNSLELRDYQMDGLNWLAHSWCKGNSVILADEMGLGKTIQTIGFLSYLMNQHQVYGPFLLVVPLSTVVAWQREFATWAPDMNVVVYLGDIGSRNMIREYEWVHPGNKRLKFNVIVTTYEILLKDKSFLGNINWCVLGVDEAHRLKNDDSMLYKSLFNFHTNHRLLITGTPLQNSLKELWSLLHFIMPEKFDKWIEFEDRHSNADRNGYANLHKQLESFLLRRVKKDVEKSLPAKVEQILRVELSSIQKQYYRWILTKNYKSLSRGVKGSISGFINIVMELKKCCNHAFLVRQPDDNDERIHGVVKGSGKLLLLDKLLARLKATGHRVLIFSQMVRMLDILADYLKSRRWNFQRLDGSIRGELRKQALDHFNAEDSNDFCFLLSTRAGGLGINLATADTVIIFDSDWNPQNDLQAQARAHRIGQKNQVSVYRLVHKDTVEEDIIERAKRKMVLDHLVIQRMDTTGRTVLNRGSVPSSSTPFNKDELAQILKFGAENLFKDASENDEEPQVDIDEILQRAETREVEDESKGANNDLLSQFKVVSFDAIDENSVDDAPTPTPETNDNTMDRDWDDIIPEEERRKIDEEERQKQLLDLELGPRNRKPLLDLNYDSDEGKNSRKKKTHDEDDYSESSDDSDDDKPKKRGRPGRGGAKDKIKGFTNIEIRRFIKSYKKFGDPKKRLDAIAGDAELQEKSEADLSRLAEELHNRCEQCMAEYKQKLEEDSNLESAKKNHRGPSCKLGSVNVNAKSILHNEEEMLPLARMLPEDKQERATYRLNHTTKSSNWDCEWDEADDSNLLIGIYEYGMGSWEAIKMDPLLNLHDKILPDGDLKPQTKHLQTRTDYLLRILLKQYNAKTGKDLVSKAPRKKREKKEKKQVFKSKEIIEDEPDLSDGEIHDENSMDPHEFKKAKKAKEKKEKKERKEEKKKGGKDGPMHFTAITEPTAIGLDGDLSTDLDPAVFKKCKEQMRPVKKALKQLDNPEAGLSERDQLDHTRKCLLKIGDRINECLTKAKDPEKIKEWRSFLWVFVSKFTEHDARKLHKLYKHAVKKRDSEREKHSHEHKHEHKQKTSNDSKGSPVKKKHDHKHSGEKAHKSKPSTSDSRNRGDSAPNGPRHFNNNAYNSYNRPPGVKESATDRWNLSSPLARPEEQRNRPYDAYNRPPNTDVHRKYPQDGNRFNHDQKGSFSSYNRDRGGYGYHKPDLAGDHSSRGDHKDFSRDRSHRPDHRGDYNNRDHRSNPNVSRDPRDSRDRDVWNRDHYGTHRTDFPAASHPARQPEDDRYSTQYHSERKRRTDSPSREKRPYKEPRLQEIPRDPRLQAQSHAPSVDH